MTKINVRQISKAEKIAVWVARKVETLQIGKKLFILNGHDPMRYLDLATNKVHQYKNTKDIKYTYKII